MLAATKDCFSYQNFISKIINPESVVADVRTGRGVMDLFAAQAGAMKKFGGIVVQSALICQEIWLSLWSILLANFRK